MAFTETELKQMALQLSHPQGDQGVQIAEMMYESNFGMIKDAVTKLQIGTNDCVLELGHGNGKHLPFVLQQANNIQYHGLEISTLMSNEARQTNSQENVSFHVYQGQEIPFADNYFHKAFTVNTIYFWEEPVNILKEIHRVLNDGGLLCIGFAQKTFMEQLPFTKFGFNLYDDEKLNDLIKKTSFELKAITSYTETITAKTEEKIDRQYSVATLKK